MVLLAIVISFLLLLFDFKWSCGVIWRNNFLEIKSFHVISQITWYHKNYNHSSYRITVAQRCSKQFENKSDMPQHNTGPANFLFIFTLTIHKFDISALNPYDELVS